MALSLQQLLALYQLNRIGRTKVITLGKYLEYYACTSEIELLDALMECIGKKIIIGTNPDGYSLKMVHDAMNKADAILSDAANNGVSILSFFDESYPDYLRHIVKKNASKVLDSPAFIYVKGDASLLSTRIGVAIVGSREATDEGIKAGEYFGRLFAEAGLNVISGLAIGCDSSAHRGALQSNGITTAILAHGLDQVFPRENFSLANQILDQGGLLVSEYPIGTKPISNYFVERDRLQSGLASGTIVVQTSKNGGTMHAVNATIENGKPLYAVQYKDINENGILSKSDRFEGNMWLLNEKKAKPLTRTTFFDALCEIREFQRDNSKTEDIGIQLTLL